MTARHFLIVVAIVQGGLLAALIVLIILNRWFRLRRSTRLNPRRQAVDASMRRWAAGTTPLAGVLVGLARLPVPLAIDALVGWSARVPGEPWRQLAGALDNARHEVLLADVEDRAHGLTETFFITMTRVGVPLGSAGLPSRPIRCTTLAHGASSVRSVRAEISTPASTTCVATMIRSAAVSPPCWSCSFSLSRS